MLTPIQAQLPAELAQRMNLDPSEVRRVLAGVHQRGQDRLDIPTPRISRRTCEALASGYSVGRLQIVGTFSSRLDPFAKFVCSSDDGAPFETVRIPLHKPGCYSVCVSSQIGCGCGCKFCKTAELGLSRNLDAWEIVEQVRIVRQSLPKGARVSGVVFQGMGEPLANLDAVIQAIRVLSEPCAQAIDQRAMTVCTVGLPKALMRLAQAELRVRVGLSIGSARPELRRRLMPIDGPCPLRESVDALIEYTRRAQHSPMLSYTLIRGVNTHPEDAVALRELALEIGERTGRMPRLSLVPYNSRGPEDPFSRAEAEEAEQFRLGLVSAGFPVVRRYSGGADIGAACGQLAAGGSDGSG